jgi:hypothetical protein
MAKQSNAYVAKAIAITVNRSGLAKRIFNQLRRAPNRSQGRILKGERFLSPQADAFAGANAEEKVGLLRSKCQCGEGRAAASRMGVPGNQSVGASD